MTTRVSRLSLAEKLERYEIAVAALPSGLTRLQHETAMAQIRAALELSPIDLMTIREAPPRTSFLGVTGAVEWHGKPSLLDRVRTGIRRFLRLLRRGDISAWLFSLFLFLMVFSVALQVENARLERAVQRVEEAR